MTVDDIFDALYLQAKDQIGLTKLRDIVLTDESINRLQFNRKGQEPIEFIKEKHGRWVKDNGPYSLYKCSACNDYCTVAGWANCIPEEQMYKGFKYCPNCGASMDESEAEE